MTITQIEYFVEVARTMSYSKASENLYVSRQTLGKQIQALEKELNIALFDRSNKRDIQLTESGRILYSAWEELLQKNNEAIWAAREKSITEKTIVRVGIHEMPYLTDTLLSLMKHFLNNHPNIAFVNNTGGMELLEGQLKQNMVDLLFCLSTELEGMGKVNYLSLGKVDAKPCIVMSKDHPLAKKKIGLSDLDQQPLLSYSRRFSADAYDRLMQNIKKRGIKPASVTHYNNTADLEMALNLGEGVSLAFDISFRNRESLKFFLVPDDPAQSLDLVVCWNQSKYERIARMLAEEAKQILKL